MIKEDENSGCKFCLTIGIARRLFSEDDGSSRGSFKSKTNIERRNEELKQYLRISSDIFNSVSDKYFLSYWYVRIVLTY